MAEKKATIKELREFFESGNNRKVSMQELKDIKGVNGGADYDQVAKGIGDGTLTY